MTVRVYRSLDTGAPALDGTAGSLAALLDAILVNGYNTNNPPGAGWTIPYTGTNTRTYQQGTGSNGFFLHVNDNGPGAGTYKEARIFGSELASAVLTGTLLFPTAAQMANGLFVRKSVALDATPRAWVALADARTLYLFVLTGDTVSVYLAWAFGEFYSFAPSDPGRCMIIARIVENSGSASTSTELMPIFDTIGNVVAGHYLVRDAQGNAGAIVCGKVGDHSVYTTPSGLQGNIGQVAFKNPADNFVYTAPVRLHHTVGGNTFRGRLRGFWHWTHSQASASDGDTFAGTADLNGKSFEIIKAAASSALYVMETSDTWDSN